MKILWCHEVSYLRKPIYEYQDFAERLAGRGHEVEVIDFDESTATTGGSVRLSRTGEGEVTLSSIPHGNTPLLKFAVARLRFRRMLSARLERGDVDALFVYSVFINGSEAVRLGRRHGVPVIYRAIDAYHRLRPGRLARSLLKAGERYIYRNADKVLCTNELMRDYVASFQSPAASASLEVLDHGVDTRHFRPFPRDAGLCEQLGIGRRDPVVLFLGTTYGFSGLAGLVRALPSLLADRPDLRLVIMGAGELDATLSQMRAELGLQQAVVLTGMIDYVDLPRYLSLATYAINPFEINDITRDIVPIKVLQYQASAIPVVSTPLPDLMKKHPHAVSGVTYSSSDRTEDFVESLRDLMDSGGGRSQGERGLEFVSRHYSVDHTIEMLEQELLTITKVAK